jgi:hypothetical protein
MLLIGKQMFLFNQIGFCWDGQDTKAQQSTCVESVRRKLELSTELSFDSVYVFREKFIAEADTIVRRMYISKGLPLILKKESSKNGVPIESERVIALEKD